MFLFINTSTRICNIHKLDLLQQPKARATPGTMYKALNGDPRN